MTLELFASFIGRIWPGLLLLGAVFVFLKPSKNLRIVLYLLSFVLLRDAMTPQGLWSFGANYGVFWIRMATDNGFLILFGVSALVLTLGMYWLDKENQDRWHWLRGKPVLGLSLGLVAAALVVLPLAIAYGFQDISLRGGVVDGGQTLPILIFALLGNFMEEGLFRGYVLHSLQEKHGEIKAGLLSGLVFSFCHIFLALTVTGVGWPLLLFALWEGCIAGIIGAKYGVIPATLTHGGAIFLLSVGWF
jgi:membrane protease YdiL (CAAX protease family)